MTRVDKGWLIKQAQMGDNKAFELLIDEHFKKIYNIAYRLSGNEADASDMTQEVLIKIFRHIGSFSGNSKFSTWVYRVATNTCLDELKKIKRRSTYSLDAELDTGENEVVVQVRDEAPTPDIAAEQKELSAAVGKAIKRLSPDHSAVVILRDIQGMSYEEVAKILNCSVGTVKSRLNRGRAQLKKILEKDSYFNGTFSKE
ncbi:MAG: sigma-70 family RNA polymerase sigma factor [Clostridia bacterium]|nr:sigma-70 family RNA polymerase sigma factor [Clostridia bacterium]